MIYAIEHPNGKKERLIFAWPLRYFFRYEVFEGGLSVPKSWHWPVLIYGCSDVIT